MLHQRAGLSGRLVGLMAVFLLLTGFTDQSREPFRQGVESLVAGNIDMAIIQLKQALAMDAREPMIHLNLGTALRVRRMHGDALRHFNTAVALFDVKDGPSRANALYQIALTYTEMYDYRSALKTWKDYINYSQQAPPEQAYVAIAKQWVALLEQGIKDDRLAPSDIIPKLPPLPQPQSMMAPGQPMPGQPMMMPSGQPMPGQPMMMPPGQPMMPAPQPGSM